MKLGIASTLMASIPMITFGLLSGSAMAMTNVAGSMSAKDYTDENKVAPSVGSNDAAVKNGSLIDSGSPISVKRLDNQIAGGNQSAINNNMDVLGTTDNAGAATKANQAAAKYEESTRKTVGQNLQQGYEKAKSEGRGKEYLEATRNGLSSTIGSSAMSQIQKVMSSSEVNQLSESEKQSLEMSLMLKAGGFGGGLSEELATSKNHSIAESALNSVNFGSAKQRGVTDVADRSFGRNLKTAFASTKGATASEALKRSLDNSTAASEALTETELFSNSTTARQSYNFADVGATLDKDSNGLSGSIINRALSPENEEAYQNELRNITAAQKRQGLTGMPGQDTGAKLLALQRVDPSAYIKVLSQMHLAGNSNKPSSNFTNVKPELANKPVKELAAGVKKEGEVAEKRVNGVIGNEGGKVREQTKGSENLKDQAGANVAEGEGYALVANSRIESEQKDANTNRLDKDGFMADEKAIAEAKDRYAEFVRRGVASGMGNENGEATPFNNIRHAIDQFNAFEKENPKAALALSMLPVARAAKAAKLLSEAKFAAGAGVRTAEAALNAAKQKLAQTSANAAAHNAPGAMAKIGGKEAAKAEQAAALKEYTMAAEKLQAERAALNTTLKTDKKILKAESNFNNEAALAATDAGFNGVAASQRK